MKSLALPILILCAGCARETATTSLDAAPGDTGATSSVDAGASPDAEDAGSRGPRHCVYNGRTIPAGMVFSDGCNQCYCEAAGFGRGCTGDVCEATCTAALCACGTDGGPVEAGACMVQCTAQGQCGQGAGGTNPCLFDPGCEPAVGYCVHTQPGCGYAETPNVPSTATEGVICGCDGVTYAGPCPKVPYRHVGPCP